MPNAIDCINADAALAQAETLKASGIEVIGLYTFEASGIKQLLTADVARRVTAAGFRVTNIWENGSPTKPQYFSADRGKTDGHFALARALSAQQPAETHIILTVDYGAESPDLDAICAYFSAAQPIVKADGYDLGAYADWLVLKRLLDEGLISFSMLTGSKGFPGYGDGVAQADMVQSIPNPGVKPFGLNCDLDTIKPSSVAKVAWSLT